LGNFAKQGNKKQPGRGHGKNIFVSLHGHHIPHKG